MINRLRDSLKFRTQFSTKGPQHDIVIFDDYLPAQGSRWRNFEYNELAGVFHNLVIYSDTDNYERYAESQSYQENLAAIEKDYPHLSGKIKALKPKSPINSKLVYTLFYKNIHRLYPHLQLHDQAFGFTLYPGGEFIVNDAYVDQRLTEIISNNLCKFVIVTQEFTHNYLINELKLDASKIHLCFGVPLDTRSLPEHISRDTKDSAPLECVFVANKYMNYGLDKGLDTFLSLAHVLRNNSQFNFSVVGNYDVSDALISTAESNVSFHGKLFEDQLDSFLRTMDVIISPNRRNVLKLGAFDGFPLASALSAGVQGCCMLLTNPTVESPERFVDGRDYIQINNDFLELAEQLIDLEKDREKIRNIAANGRKAIENEYSYAAQIKKRVSLFDQILKQ